MPMGPGVYDHECTRVRKRTKASGVALIVIGGDKGSGFSVQADALITLTLPEMLESMAKQIRASYAKGKL